MSDIRILNLEGQVVGQLKVPESLTGSVNRKILWQAVRMYLANQRQGNADTKTRGEVRGGGKKPWKQKHTGRARAGSIRSPLWRKGGIVFGPHPREYRYSLPEALRRQALVESLKAKVSSDALLAVQGMDGLAAKTKALNKALELMKVENQSLLVVDQVNVNLVRASRNLPKVRVKRVADLNCYDVLHSSKLVMTPEAFGQLEKILS